MLVRRPGYPQGVPLLYTAVRFALISLWVLKGNCALHDYSTKSVKGQRVLSCSYFLHGKCGLSRSGWSGNEQPKRSAFNFGQADRNVRFVVGSFQGDEHRPRGQPIFHSRNELQWQRDFHLYRHVSCGSQQPWWDDSVHVHDHQRAWQHECQHHCKPGCHNCYLPVHDLRRALSRPHLPRHRRGDI
jgi:hypothetical protein